MSGPTVVMAPAVDHHHPHSPSSSIARSFSTPELLSSPTFQDKSNTSNKSPKPGHQRQWSEKDLPSLPSFDLISFDNFELDTSMFGKRDKSTPTTPSASSSASEHTTSTSKPRPSFTRTRTNPLIERPRSWFPSSKPSKDGPELSFTRPATSAGPSDDGAGQVDLRHLEQNMSVADSFASFAKRSWKTSSCPPSPKIKPTTPVEGQPPGQETKTPTKLSRIRKQQRRSNDQPGTAQSSDSSTSTSTSTTPKAFTRAASYFMKKKQTKGAVLANHGFVLDSDNSCASSAASSTLAASQSGETRTSQSTSCDCTDESSSEKPAHLRDTLWASFRALDLEFNGFSSKPLGQRILLVQSVLTPFLRNTAPGLPGSKGLLLEDLDRRATVLNKWWLAILEMLDSQEQLAVPGVDRPLLLEAATMIMMRPEWRHATTCFQRLSDRSPTERLRPRSMTNSSTSTRSSSHGAFLAESAEHNVRTMFVSGLVKQMAFVIDKMSLRHAPLSLVNFAGKTCAYAFFFVPGIADILVRLWSLMPDLIKRSSDLLGLPRKNDGGSEDIASLFPPTLGGLTWTSSKSTWDSLKRIPKMPVLVARIPWTGPWVGRWKGRDTDLFFVFCKYFHTLADQFIPAGLPLVEIARSPAFVLVHAQLLAVLESTIYRQGPIPNAYGSPLVDAAALSLPLPPNNMTKGMCENRLVILLRNFLTDDSADVLGARHTFAQTFALIMQCATRRISLFDSAAVFTLCDFLEESLVLYNEFEDPLKNESYIDWNFWLDVFKRMLTSCNTSSDVRVLSLTFTIWNAIAKDPRRKAALCLDWLLTPEIFNAYFNHWCPMVRAYYHRLLCWRICRDEGSANDVDMNIFLVVAARLKTTWAHYLFLKRAAEDGKKLPPSTAPILPAPGKKLMIIRQELNTPQQGLFIGSDSTSQPSSGNPFPDPVDDDEVAKGDGKKRWSLLGKMLSLSGNSGTRTPPGSSDESAPWGDQLQTVRRETAESRSRSNGPPRVPPKISLSNSAAASDFDSTCSSPTFDEQKYVFKFILSWLQPSMPPRERILTRPRLPAPAQSWVTVRARRGSSAAQAPAPVILPTRKISGNAQGGLINGARNASFDTEEPVKRLVESPNSFMTANSRESECSASDMDDDASGSHRDGNDVHGSDPSGNRELIMEPMTEPVKPEGFYAQNSVYTGRALAEWSLVVYECNCFLDRRRDEGVLGLSDVEVPLLGVEGFRRIGG